MTDPNQESASRLAADLMFAFQPLHKRAFGVAVGTAAGVCVAAATIIVLIQGAGDTISLHLLNQYFYGYSVSWIGVPIGFAWAFVVGFTAGWFVAFCRNLVLAVSMFAVRTRAELFQSHDFLDHI
jgi:hypothetical protein